MKYNWDIMKLIKIALTNKNGDYQFFAETALFDYFKSKYNIKNYHLEYEMSYDEDIYFLKENAYILDIIKKLSEYQLLIQNSKRKYTKENNLLYSPDDILQIIDSFFNHLQFDKEIYDAYLNLYNHRFNHILFFNNPNADYSESTYFCGKSDAFIVINNNKRYNSASILAHEYGHAIASSICQKYSYNYRCTKEIESYFFELLFDMYLLSKPNDLINKFPQLIENAKNNIISLLQINFIITNRILKKSQLINYEKYFLSYHCSFNDIREYILSSVNLKNNELNNIIKTNYYTNYYYPISIIYVIELVCLYENDPEKALYLYKKIINNNPTKDLEQLKFIENLQIYPFEHFDEFIRKLEK